MGRLFEGRWRRQREKRKSKKEEQERVGKKEKHKSISKKTHKKKRHNSLWLIEFPPIFLTHTQTHANITKTHNAAKEESKDRWYSDVRSTRKRDDKEKDGKAAVEWRWCGQRPGKGCVHS